MAASAISGNEGARCAFGDVRKADPKDQSVIGLRPALPVAHASRQRKRHSRKAYVSFSNDHTAETKTSTSLRLQPKAKQCRGPDRGCIRGSRHLTRPNRCTQAPGRFRARFFHIFARALSLSRGRPEQLVSLGWISPSLHDTCLQQPSAKPCLNLKWHQSEACTLQPQSQSRQGKAEELLLGPNSRCQTLEGWRGWAIEIWRSQLATRKEHVQQFHTAYESTAS